MSEKNPIQRMKMSLGRVTDSLEALSRRLTAERSEAGRSRDDEPES
jgi:hypothetical protein